MIKQHTIDKIEQIFKELVQNEDKYSKEGYCIMVSTTDDWQYPIPAHTKGVDYMRIDITGWTKEESYLDESGIYVKTAFGEEENSKFFPYSQILGLMTPEGISIFTKPYILKTEEKKYSLKDVMTNTKGLEKSKKALSLVTPKPNEKIKTKKKKEKKKKKDK